MSGISKILHQAMEEVKNGNFSVRQKLLKITSKFVNGVEISAQEAAYSLLGLHMSEASVATCFVNTFPPNERTKMLKSKFDLENLPVDSNDIFAENYLDYYEFRPESMKSCCLAEFVAGYEFRRVTNNNEKLIKLNENRGFIYKRKKMKVMRYRRYNKDVDPDNFFRENVMLFLPYWSETNDIINKDVKEIYFANFAVIAENSLKFNKYEKEMDEINKEAIDDHNEIGDETDPEFQVYGLQEMDHDLSLDLPNLTNERVYNIRKETVVLDESDYIELMRSLNDKQRIYLSHLHHNIVHGKEFHEFVSG